MSQVDRTIEFLHTLGKTKEIPRTGWVEAGVPNVESIAAHMYRVGFMCMMCPDPTLDKARMMKIALCHDMAESIVGDISPAMKVPKEEKHEKEEAAMAYMTSLLTPELQGPQMREYFDEYEAQITPESQFVKDMDVLDMVVQAHRYEALTGKVLPSFFASGSRITHPWAVEILERLKATRPNAVKEDSKL